MGNLFRRRFIPALAVVLSLVPAAALTAFMIPRMTTGLTNWLALNSGSAWRLEFLEARSAKTSSYVFYNGKISVSFQKSSNAILCTVKAGLDRGLLRIYSRPDSGHEHDIPFSIEPVTGKNGEKRGIQVFRFAVVDRASYSFSQDVKGNGGGNGRATQDGPLTELEKAAARLAALVASNQSDYDIFSFRLTPETGAVGSSLLRFTASGRPGALAAANPDMEFPAKYPFLLPESGTEVKRSENLQFVGPNFKPGAVRIPGRFLIPLYFLPEPLSGFVLAQKSESGSYSIINESGGPVTVARGLALRTPQKAAFYPVFSQNGDIFGFHVPKVWIDHFSNLQEQALPMPGHEQAEFLAVNGKGRTFAPNRDALFIGGLGFTLREASFAPLAGFVTAAFAMLFFVFFAVMGLVYLLFPYFSVRFSRGNTGASLYSLCASGLTVYLVTGLTFIGLFLLLYLNLDSTVYPELNKVHFFLDCSQGVFQVTGASFVVFIVLALLKAFRPARNFLFGWFFDEARHARRLFFLTFISFAVSVGVFALKPGRGIILLCSSTLLLLFPLAFTSYLTYFRLRVKRRLSLGGVAVFSGIIPLLGFAVPLALYDEFGPILIYSIFLFLAWPAVGFFTDKNRLLPVREELTGRMYRIVISFFVVSCTLFIPIAWFVLDYPPLAALFAMPLAYSALDRVLHRFGRTFSPNMAQTLFIVWLGIGATASLLCFYQKDFDLPGVDTFYSRMDKMNVPALRDDADIPHSLIYVPGTRLGSLARRIHTDFAMSLARSLYKDVFTDTASTLLVASLLSAYLAVLFLSLWQMQAYTRHQSVKRLNEPLFRFVCLAFLGVFALYSFLSTGCYLPLTGVPFPLVSDGDSYRLFTLVLLWISIVCPWQERTF